MTYGHDAYELILSDDVSISSIIRYRHMRNSGGEFVDYDSLSEGVQTAISNKLVDLIDNIENEDSP